VWGCCNDIAVLFHPEMIVLELKEICWCCWYCFSFRRFSSHKSGPVDQIIVKKSRNALKTVFVRRIFLNPHNVQV